MRRRISPLFRVQGSTEYVVKLLYSHYFVFLLDAPICQYYGTKSKRLP